MIGTALSFAANPMIRWAAIGLAFFLWTAYQRDKAADSARAECRSEQIQKTLNEVIRQRDASQQALAEAETIVAQNEKEMGDLRSEKDAIMVELAERGAAACVIPYDSLRRLRNIK